MVINWLTNYRPLDCAQVKQTREPYLFDIWRKKLYKSWEHKHKQDPLGDQNDL